ncbi:MAG: ATP-binding response regulator [Candidatus Eiseniibacteriota bacterium]
MVDREDDDEDEDALLRSVALQNAQSVRRARQRADDALRDSERRLQFVLDSVPQKIFTARPNGDLDYANPQWTEFIGVPFERLQDRGWMQFVHPEDASATIRAWRRSIDTGEPFQFELRFQDAEGRYRWHLSRAVPLRDDEGAIVMWVGSNTDVHEVKEADRRKNEFIAMLAHELRNPLAPIGNALKVLRKAQGNREAVESATEMMERQVAQMVRLVDDLLDASRVSRGRIELRRSRIDLLSAVNDAVEASRELCRSLNHELEVLLPDGPLHLEADPLRLTQVVGNLLNNACKFTNQGGHIRLTVAREGNEAVIRVRDNGIGIAADQRTCIFDMFMQVDTSLERTVSGLGIGLTLVKNLVELHGGTVEVESGGPGQGSEFIVRLPISVDAAKAPESPEAATPAPRPAVVKGCRILVVEDNQDSAASLAMFLKLSGNETLIACDGLEAVESTEAFRPDVVLLDLGLPRLNGYEVARKIREQPWGRDIVLVALTGWGQDADRAKSQEAGFDAHLVKPVDFGALTKLLASRTRP